MKGAFGVEQRRLGGRLSEKKLGFRRLFLRMARHLPILTQHQGARLPEEADPGETKRDAAAGQSEVPPGNGGVTPYINKGCLCLPMGSWNPGHQDDTSP